MSTASQDGRLLAWADPAQLLPQVRTLTLLLARVRPGSLHLLDGPLTLADPDVARALRALIRSPGVLERLSIDGLDLQLTDHLDRELAVMLTACGRPRRRAPTP